MRISYNNYIDSRPASSLTALNEAVGFPIINTQDQRLSTCYRSTAVTSQTVIIDTVAVDGYFLIGVQLVVTSAPVVSYNILTCAYGL